MLPKEVCLPDNHNRFKTNKQSHFRNQTEMVHLNQSKQHTKTTRETNKLNECQANKSLFSGFEAPKNQKFFQVYFKTLYKKEVSLGSKMRKITLSTNNYIDGSEKKKGRKGEEYLKSSTKSNVSESHHESKSLKESEKRRSLDFEGFEKKKSLLHLENSRISIENWRIELDKICDCLTELKGLDSAEKKIHKWCENYFDSKKKELIHVFMRKLNTKKSLNDEVMHVVICEKEIIFNRLIKAISPMTEKERYFMGIEISLYKNFLEEKIANKQKMELHQIENRVRSNLDKPHMKLFAKDFYRTVNTNSEVNGFFSDLQRLEESYGKLNLLSCKNRRRFENISESEIIIKNMINA